MDAERIRRQLRALKDGGCIGAFIHPRQGYPDAYLSAHWRELVTLAVREGAALGLAIGVCDEFPYPSGNAGGLATLGHPQRWATELEQCFLEVSGGTVLWDLPAGAVLSCAAYSIAENEYVDWSQCLDLLPDVGVHFRQETFSERDRDLSPYNGRRYFACDPAPRLETKLPPGSWLLSAAVQVVAEDRKYVGHAADTLDAEAMGAALAVTLSAYEGLPISAIFIDEIKPSSWSRHLPRHYKELTGEDLPHLLPALVRDDHPSAKMVRENIDVVRKKLFLESFLNPLRGWCSSRGVILCEERHLDRLADAAADIPGCDPGHTRVGARRHDLLGEEPRRNARSASAAAKGGPALCECGHSLGWNATIEDLRLIFDGLLQHGITHLVPHAAFASAAALRKHDAPPSYFYQQSWWHLHCHLAERVSYIQAALAGTVLEPELLIPPGSSEDVQHRLMSGGWEWSFSDQATPINDMNIAKPRWLPWSNNSLVHRTIRCDGGRAIALLINYSNDLAMVRLPVSWNPLPLDRVAPERRGDDWLLEPAQAMLASSAAEECAFVPHVDFPWPKTWSIRPMHGNTMRLGKWELTIDGKTSTVTHFPLSEQLRRSGLSVRPHIDPGLGSPYRVSLPNIECTYKAHVFLSEKIPLRLLMERETFVDAEWIISINNGPELRAHDFSPVTIPIDDSMGVDVTGLMKIGDNYIVIRCRSQRLDGGLRNPLYLHGEFSVGPDGKMGQPIATCAWGDLAGAGLPHVCGMLEWSAMIELPESPNAPLIGLRMPKLEVDSYEVALDEGPWFPILWSPRRMLLPRWKKGLHCLRIRQYLPLGRCFHAEAWSSHVHANVAVDNMVH